jgi:hypothetical protein
LLDQLVELAGIRLIEQAKVGVVLYWQPPRHDAAIIACGFIWSGTILGMGRGTVLNSCGWQIPEGRYTRPTASQAVRRSSQAGAFSKHQETIAASHFAALGLSPDQLWVEDLGCGAERPDPDGRAAGRPPRCAR